MKRGDEALKALLQFFRSIPRFIAKNFHSGFNASSLLLFKKESLFNASSPLLYWIARTSIFPRSSLLGAGQLGI
jgi:hypothetical protein